MTLEELKESMKLHHQKEVEARSRGERGVAEIESLRWEIEYFAWARQSAIQAGSQLTTSNGKDLGLFIAGLEVRLTILETMKGQNG